MIPFLLLGAGAFLLIWGAVKGHSPLDPITTAFGGEPHPIRSPAAVGPPGQTPANAPAIEQRQPQPGRAVVTYLSPPAAIAAIASRVAAYVRGRWPTAVYAGTYSCRHERGTGSDPGRWSTHAWGGAVDFFGPSHRPDDPVTQEILRWANTDGHALGIYQAWIDHTPGDVHIQIIPNPPAGAVPPCASSGAA